MSNRRYFQNEERIKDKNHWLDARHSSDEYFLTKWIFDNLQICVRTNQGIMVSSAKLFLSSGKQKNSFYATLFIYNKLFLKKFFFHGVFTKSWWEINLALLPCCAFTPHYCAVVQRRRVVPTFLIQRIVLNFRGNRLACNRYARDMKK